MYHWIFIINQVEGFGQGRICTLAEALSIEEVANKVKAHLGLKHVRLATSSNIEKDKVCFYTLLLLIRMNIVEREWVSRGWFLIQFCRGTPIMT